MGKCTVFECFPPQSLPKTRLHISSSPPFLCVYDAKLPLVLKHRSRTGQHLGGLPAIPPEDQVESRFCTQKTLMVQLRGLKGDAVGRTKRGRTRASEQNSSSLTSAPSSNHTLSINLHASPAGILLTNRYMPREASQGGNANAPPASDSSPSRERTPLHESGTLPRLLPIQPASRGSIPFTQQRQSNFDFVNNPDIPAQARNQIWSAIFDLQRRVAHLEALVFEGNTSERSKSTMMSSFPTSPVTMPSRSNHTTPGGTAGATLVSQFFIPFCSVELWNEQVSRC